MTFDIQDFINNDNNVEPEQLDKLSKLMEEYPFFHSVRLAYIYALYKTGDEKFNQELQKASLLVPDRQALFTLLEQQHYVLKPQVTENNAEIIADDKDRHPFNLIDNFLSKIEDESEAQDKDLTKPHPLPTVAEVTSNYAMFLSSQDLQPENVTPSSKSSDNQRISDSTAAEDSDHHTELIDNFINHTQGKQRYEIEDTNDKQFSVNPDIEPQLYYTEKIANLCIQQGRYEEALEILKKISLDEPDKSVNFASKMQLLNVILETKK